ncbi:pyridine nucleotide-disulfide oxidoreductase, partial [Klebsiella pneumoniae]
TQLVAFNNARIVKLAKRWMAAGRDLSNVPLADPTFSLMSLR